MQNLRFIRQSLDESGIVTELENDVRNYMAKAKQYLNLLPKNQAALFWPAWPIISHNANTRLHRLYAGRDKSDAAILLQLPQSAAIAVLFFCSRVGKL